VRLYRTLLVPMYIPPSPRTATADHCICRVVMTQSGVTGVSFQPLACLVLPPHPASIVSAWGAA
jgi:hypothetical protein